MTTDGSRLLWDDAIPEWGDIEGMTEDYKRSLHSVVDFQRNAQWQIVVDGVEDVGENAAPQLPAPRDAPDGDADEAAAAAAPPNKRRQRRQRTPRHSSDEDEEEEFSLMRQSDGEKAEEAGANGDIDEQPQRVSDGDSEQAKCRRKKRASTSAERDAGASTQRLRSPPAASSRRARATLLSGIADSDVEVSDPEVAVVRKEFSAEELEEINKWRQAARKESSSGFRCYVDSLDDRGLWIYLELVKDPASGRKWGVVPEMDAARKRKRSTRLRGFVDSFLSDSE